MTSYGKTLSEHLDNKKVVDYPLTKQNIEDNKILIFYSYNVFCTPGIEICLNKI
jgi:hypothetical protein